MKLIEKFYKNYENDEEKEILEYGYEMLKTVVFGLIGAVIIATIMNELLYGMTLLIVIIPLRQNAGGFHAKSKGMCAIISVLIYICALLIIKYLPINKWALIGVFFLSAVVIIHDAPVDNVNNRLDETELKVYGNRTRIVLAIESVLFMLMFACRMYSLSLTVVESFVIVAMILIAGKVKNKMD